MRAIVMFGLCGVLLSPQPAPAQTPVRDWSPRGAEALLKSPDEKDQAWGAWIAGRIRDKAAVPLIESVVKTALATNVYAPRLYVAVDALIELDARPDPTLLLELFKTRPTQALILLSRLGPAANAPLLDILSRADSYEWFAAANLLSARKAPGFAALILQKVEFVASVQVSVEGNLSQASGGLSGAVGDKAGGLAEGYPPIADYEFRSCGRPDLGLLAPGPLNVCYERYVSDAGIFPALPSHSRSGPTINDRLNFIRPAVLNLELNSIEIKSIAFKDDTTTRAEMAQLVEILRRRYRYLLSELVKNGMLTDREAATLSNPVIREEIVDLRKPQN